MDRRDNNIVNFFSYIFQNVQNIRKNVYDIIISPIYHKIYPNFLRIKLINIGYKNNCEQSKAPSTVLHMALEMNRPDPDTL